MNYKIVIDPGHGGDDPGASGNDIVEKDLTLKISNYMKNRFDELGINSAINRTSDITLNPDNRVDKTLSHFGNGENVIVLSNHINAGGGKQSLSEVGLQSDLKHIWDVYLVASKNYF